MTNTNPMDKKDLITSAGKLGPFSKATAEAYAAASQRMVARINEQMLSRPDIDKLVGQAGREMMCDNHANHARFIASILENHNPEVLAETILWVFRAYRSRGFASTYWAAQLNTWMGIIREELPAEAYEETLPLYGWMQVNIPLFEHLSHQ